MNASQGLVKGYKIDDAEGVGQYVAVVQGTSDGACQKPAAENAAGYLGQTLEAQPYQYHGVAVQKSGIARAIADGQITRGDRLIISGTAGKLKSAEAAITAVLANPAKVYEVVGRAEESAADAQIFAVWLGTETVPLAVS